MTAARCAARSQRIARLNAERTPAPSAIYNSLTQRLVQVRRASKGTSSMIVGRAISASTMRDVVKSKLRAGATKDAINLLILSYVPPEARTDRVERGISRQALENIPRERRADFLQALQEIPALRGSLVTA